MNFLSHFYFDHRKNDPNFNFGLLLPDLSRNFVPGLRVGVLDEGDVHETIHNINEGCKQHVRSDRLFHDWERFEDLMLLVKNEFRKDPETRPERDWFVAHIFVELMIDHYLLIENSDLANQLYDSYDQVSAQNIDQFLRQANADANQINRFQDGMKRFLKHRYLSSYDRPENVIYALERICNKMNISAFSDSQKRRYMQILSKLERNIVHTTSELQDLLR